MRMLLRLLRWPSILLLLLVTAAIVVARVRTPVLPVLGTQVALGTEHVSISTAPPGVTTDGTMWTFPSGPRIMLGARSRWRPTRSSGFVSVGGWTGRVDALFIPWCVIGAAAAIGVVLCWWLGGRRPAAGCCPACGYDLTGRRSARCPECGCVSAGRRSPQPEPGGRP
jgi:hypothetical protein